MSLNPRRAWVERFKERLNKIEKGELVSPNKASELTGSNWNSTVNFINFLVEKGIPVGHTASGEPKKLVFPPVGWAYMDEPSDLIKLYRLRCRCGFENLVIPSHATLCPSCEDRTFFMCECEEPRDITSENAFTCHRCRKNYISCKDCLEAILVSSSECYEVTCPYCGKTQSCFPINGVVLDVDGQPIGGALVKLDGRSENTDSHGQYKFVNIPVGKFQFYIAHAGYEEHKDWIDVSNSQWLIAYLQKKKVPSILQIVGPLAFGTSLLLISKLLE